MPRAAFFLTSNREYSDRAATPSSRASAARIVDDLHPSSAMSDLRALLLQFSLLACGPWRAPLAIATVLLLMQIGPVMASDTADLPSGPVTTNAGRTTVSRIVTGIVSYTRWPAETTSIRLCTLGHGRGVDELLGTADLGPASRSVQVHAADSFDSAKRACDAIYVGAVDGKVIRDHLQGTLGLPILTIGEDPDFCSDGGMFCLQPDAADMRFTVNLDAVARSGLRVNPWVLRIARNRREVRP